MLQQRLRRNLFAMHSMPHRLEPALRHSLKENSYIANTVEPSLNSLHSIYNAKNHKNSEYLRVIAGTMNICSYRYNYIFQSRWVASELVAIKKFNRNIELLDTTFQSMSKDIDSFNATHRSKALGQRSSLTGRIFVITTHFLEDLLGELAKHSKLFQLSGGLVIGKHIQKA